MRMIGRVLGVLLLASAFAVPAQADVILFDTNGGDAGGVVAIDLMDPTTGNAITLDIIPVVGDTGTVLFQANLGLTSQGGATNFVSCFSGSTCFTFTAAVDVVVTSVGADTVELGLDLTGDTNIFNMYANTISGNNLSGQCFASANVTCGGTLILSGAFQNFDAVFNSDTPPEPLEVLDQFTGDNYGGVQTIIGGGEFNGDILITSFLSAWFPNLTAGASLFIASSEQHLPYDQADPSACFSSNAVANCDQLGVLSVGPVNGLGVNVMTQTDANVSFRNPGVVPEPASLLLLGSGLLGAAAARRRRSRKS